MKFRCAECKDWGTRADERTRRALRFCKRANKYTDQDDTCGEGRHKNPMLHSLRQHFKGGR